MHLTVKELKKALEGAPDDAYVFYQRIEDKYFANHGWTGKEMLWEYGENCEYITAFSSYLHPDTGDFVINAHY